MNRDILKATVTVNYGECVECNGTGIYVGKTSGKESSCPFCGGEGKQTVATLLKKFKRRLAEGNEENGTH